MDRSLTNITPDLSDADGGLAKELSKVIARFYLKSLLS